MVGPLDQLDALAGVVGVVRGLKGFFNRMMSPLLFRLGWEPGDRVVLGDLLEMEPLERQEAILRLGRLFLQEAVAVEREGWRLQLL